MTEQFNGDESLFESYLAKMSVDVETILKEAAEMHEATQDHTAAKEVYFAKLAEVFDEAHPPINITAHMTQLITAIENVSDAFITATTIKLGQSDTAVAIREWGEFVIQDDIDQTRQSFLLTKLDLLPPLAAEHLPAYAFGYIKSEMRDVDYTPTQPVADVPESEAWVLRDYSNRLYARTREVLDYAPRGMLDEFEAALESYDEKAVFARGNPVKTKSIVDKLSSYLDEFQQRLLTVAHDIANDISNMGSAERYLAVQRVGIENTAMYQMYLLKATEVHKQVGDPDSSSTILTDSAFLDGFILAMIVNKQLLTNGSRFDASLLNPLAVQTNETMNRLMEHLAYEDDQDPNALIYSYGKELYADNLAHPEEPYAHHINTTINPLDQLVEQFTDALYYHHPDDSGEAVFKAGFGIGRAIYNLNRLHTMASTDSSRS